jgi:hypothetical protein
MNIDYVVLADAASAAEGKLYIHGAGWDTIQSVQFPAIHHAIAVAMRVRIAWHETNQPHSLQVDLVDADEQSLLPAPFRSDVNVGRPPGLELGDDQVLPLVVNFVNISFAKPGAYVIKVLADDEVAWRSPFTVKVVAPR